MPIIATSKGGGQRQLPPAGTHLARCYAVCDLGTQLGDFQGKPKRARKCRIFFELPNEQAVFSEDGRKEPFTVSKEFTLSLHKKAELRKVLESWRGRPFTDEELDKFDVAKLVGAAAIITIGHEARKDGEGNYARILNVTKLMAQMTNSMPPAITPQWSYEITMQRNDIFKDLPDWLQEKISKCEEWTRPSPSHDPEPAPIEAADDVPF
jgi:hypothetical protein